MKTLLGAGVVGLMVLILFALFCRGEQIAPILARTLQRLPGIGAERAGRILSSAII